MYENLLASFDQTDFRILREVTRDGRLSDVALGEQVHLSSTAAARRRKILEDRGAIAGAGKASVETPGLQRFGNRPLAVFDIGKNFNGSGNTAGKAHGSDTRGEKNFDDQP